MKRRGRITNIASWIVIAWLLCSAVMVGVFRFRHPWMTETELLLNLPHALVGQTVDRID